MTLRKMSLVLGNFRQIVAVQNVLVNRSQSLLAAKIELDNTFAGTQHRCFSVSSVCNATHQKQPSKVLADLPDGDGGGGRRRTDNVDSNAEPVPLAYISYEDKSAKKNGTITKTPLIIQHSLIGSKENWKTVSKEIHHVTKRPVFSVDARNHGDSPHTKVMSYTTMAKDIELFVKHIEAPKISFLGHSFGGRIGLLLAMMRPELIDKLVVVDSSPFVNKNSIQRWGLLRKACGLLKAIEPELKDCTGLTRRTLADKTVESVLTDKKDRALFLSNLITTDEQQKINSNGNGSDKQHLPPPQQGRIWRVNLDAILGNPKLMSEYPDIFSAENFYLTSFSIKYISSNSFYFY